MEHSKGTIAYLDFFDFFIIGCAYSCSPEQRPDNFVPLSLSVRSEMQKMQLKPWRNMNQKWERSTARIGRVSRGSRPGTLYLGTLWRLQVSFRKGGEKKKKENYFSLILDHFTLGFISCSKRKCTSCKDKHTRCLFLFSILLSEMSVNRTVMQ